MTEKKMDFLETWLLEAGFKLNNYDEKWYFGETPQTELNKIILNRNKQKDVKM